MADEIDQANDTAQQTLDLALASARCCCALPAIGVCHNCGAVVIDDHKFCDVDCRDDWQHRFERHAR